jgi:O-antigen ligase
VTRAAASGPWATVNSALLAALFFLVPTQIAPAYVLTGLMLVFWLIEGRWQQKWQALRDNPVFWVFQAYFWWVVVSLLWTSDMAAGWSMVSRYLFFLLSALYFTVVRREHMGRYLAAFAIGVVLCEALAVYNWLHLNHFPAWPDGLRAPKDAMETAPFVDRILFGPVLAFAGYVGAWKAITTSGRVRVAWALTVLSTFAVLSFSASRVGMISFSLMMALLAYQQLVRHRLLALVSAAVVLAACVSALYAFSDTVTRDRIGQIFSESHQLDTAVNESLPHRYKMAVNTMHIIAAHPWLGVGAGDFIAEYKAVNDQRSPAWKLTHNPHNQLLFNLVTTGVLGGVLLFTVWIAPPWLTRRWPDDGLRQLRIGLPVFYFFICLSESYFWRSNTGLMFMLFAALLYGPGPLPVPGEAVLPPVKPRRDSAPAGG